MIPDYIKSVLQKSNFVTVATSSLKGKPSAAPKFLLEAKKNNVYIVDYVINRTWKNLKENPRAVVTFMDIERLTAYQLVGKVQLVHNAKERARLKALFKKKVIDLTADRVIHAVHSGVKSETYEISMSARVGILKVIIKTIRIIAPTGQIRRESIRQMRVTMRKPAGESLIKTEMIPLLIPSAHETIDTEVEHT